jgi:hypothetical protein
MGESSVSDLFVSDGKRMWIVSLRVRSSARLEGDQNVHMIAEAEASALVRGVKIRNMRYESEGGSYVSGITFESAGEVTGAGEAIELLGSAALATIQVVALVANASFEEDIEILAYAPPTTNLPGRFLSQKSATTHGPASRLREIEAADLVEVFKSLRSHAAEERIQRAMAHFRLALNYLDPWSLVLAAEHLYIAAENIGRLVYKRKCAEANLPINAKDTKHLMAVAAGFPPQSDTSNSHLNDYDSYLRSEYVFHGDTASYQALKRASDGLEHGFGAFDKVRDAANTHAFAAFDHVRRAILTELALTKSSALFSDKYQYPLGSWQPKFEIFGSYADSNASTDVVIEPDSVGNPWPAFYGLNLNGYISSISDDEVTKKRCLTFRADGNGRSLINSQTVNVERTYWLLPGMGAVGDTGRYR